MNTNIMYENLLGEQVLTAERAINCTFKIMNFEHKKPETVLYMSRDFIERDYFGMSPKTLSIVANRDKAIQSITIQFHEVINRQFYDVFNEKYGNPNKVLVIHNKKVISEETSKDNVNDIISNVKNSAYDLREGTFEEKPLYIIWEKEGCQIKVYLRHRQHTSDITFSLK